MPIRLLTLPPYASMGIRDKGHRLDWLLASGTFLAGALYGSLFGLLAQTAIPVVLAPLGPLLFLVLWALPSTEKVPKKPAEVLFLAFFMALVLWPNYLALSLPNLPWITLNRLIGFPLALLLAFCAFTSKQFRATVYVPLKSVPSVAWLFAAFLVVQSLAIIVSGNPTQSLSKFVLNQIMWTNIFLMGCYVFMLPGRAMLWANILWATAVLVAIIGWCEHSIGHLLWAGHIPSFLKVGDPSVQRILTPHFRDYTGRYRTLSTFSTPLGLAEYLAFALPFILHFAVKVRQLAIRIAATASVPLLIYVVLLTDSRIGIAACLLTPLLYGLIWSLLRWRHEPKSIFGPALVLVYPAVIVAAIGTTLVSHRMHALIFGGDATQQSSTDVRRLQTSIAISKTIRRPWGYGTGMAAETVGYRTPGGILTLDSYYLTIVIEYGVLGFIVYYGMFGAAILAACRSLLLSKREDPELGLIFPATITIVNFVVIKSVFSQDDNHAIIFMTLALLIALVSRYQLPPDSVSRRAALSHALPP